ncbi:hypothetical protein B0J12DRAFT_146635 [Macrophomina phaseolina]|uniref:Uncharacterized protein n=1 Tax=Macrophomina phaseolina TaxID=35725 RepID=A0ABQ8G650_9PEZI|nr:hypothetical protein B0J12DRAFT_146635 [Macrophomina phaseolina]
MPTRTPIRSNGQAARTLRDGRPFPPSPISSNPNPVPRAAACLLVPPSQRERRCQCASVIRCRFALAARHNPLTTRPIQLLFLHHQHKPPTRLPSCHTLPSVLHNAFLPLAVLAPPLSPSFPSWPTFCFWDRGASHHPTNTLPSQSVGKSPDAGVALPSTEVNCLGSGSAGRASEREERSGSEMSHQRDVSLHHDDHRRKLPTSGDTSHHTQHALAPPAISLKEGIERGREIGRARETILTVPWLGGSRSNHHPHLG